MTTQPGPGHNSGDSDKGIAAGRLKSFIERAERLENDRQNIGTDIKEMYSEAKGEGFDVPTMRKCVKLRAMDKQDRQERDALLDTYMDAIGEA